MLNSVTSINDFIGNDTTITNITGWLNEYLEDRRETTKKYAIIFGDSGNGKTVLSYALAKSLNIPILTVTPYDLTQKEDINWLKKSLNSTTYDGTSQHKIILIDDIDNYKGRYLREQLMKNIVRLSNQPIIYTSSELWKLPDSFVKNSIHCQVKKPIYSDLVILLQKLCDKYGFKLTKSELENIVRKAPSVRSAVNSLFSPNITAWHGDKVSIFAKFKMIKDGTLDIPLDNYSLQMLTHNCKKLRDVQYLTKLVMRSELNFKSETHPFLLNHANLKLPGRYSLSMRTTSKNTKKELTEEEIKLIKKLHISSRVYRYNYKFLHVDEEKKKIDKINEEQKKHIDRVQSLSNFY